MFADFKFNAFFVSDFHLVQPGLTKHILLV